MSFAERILVAGRVPIFYLSKLIWPSALSFNYEQWNLNTSHLAQWLYPLLTFGITLSLLLAAIKKHRAVAGIGAALFFFMGTLFPALGFINVFPFRYSYVADHFQYLASIGPIVLIAVAMEFGLKRALGGKGFVIVASILILGLCSLSYQQGKSYQDVETLWHDTLKVNPNSWMSLNNLGLLRDHEGKLDEALAYFERAQVVNPKAREVLDNLGCVYMAKGQLKKAEELLLASIAADPKFPFPYQRLATLYRMTGRLKESLRMAQQSIDVMDIGDGSQSIDGLIQLANTQLAMKDHKSAINSYSEILANRPGDFSANMGMGHCLLAAKEFRQASLAFKMANKIRPNHAAPLRGLGESLANLNEVYQSVLAFSSAFPRSKNKPGVSEQIYAGIRSITMTMPSQERNNLYQQMAEAALSDRSEMLYRLSELAKTKNEASLYHMIWHESMRLAKIWQDRDLIKALNSLKQ